MNISAVTRKRFLIMPMQGLRGPQSQSTRDLFANLPRTNQLHAVRTSIGSAQVTVLDEINEDGMKLIEATDDQLHAIRSAAPGLRVVEEVFYATARSQYLAEAPAMAAVAATSIIRTDVTVTASDGKPVSNAFLVAFTSFARRIGSQGVTDSSGRVSLTFPAGTTKLDRVYIYPRDTYWTFVKRRTPLTAQLAFQIRPIDLSMPPDYMRSLYGLRDTSFGHGVNVGVIDSGVALMHPDLVLAGGVNTVPGEAPSDYGDNGGEGHGSHVAGIVAGRGTPPTGVRGLAPAVNLFSFRVFPQEIPGGQSPGASNYSIAKAIDLAIQKNCHLLNMSLGGGSPDEATATAITDAWNAGCVCIVAAGNDNRGPVSFPAAASGSIAISAMGKKGSFPADSTDSLEVKRPFGAPDASLFVAGFSNVGPQIRFTGTGVGIISSVPPDRYAAMSGTSMACPSVTGAMAAQIAGAIATMPPDANRSVAIVQAALAIARKQGFGPRFEGDGLLLP